MRFAYPLERPKRHGATYEYGITTGLRVVENTSPKTIDIAIGAKNAACPVVLNASVKRPKIVLCNRPIVWQDINKHSFGNKYV